jgi:hypothetical protein
MGAMGEHLRPKSLNDPADSRRLMLVGRRMPRSDDAGDERNEPEFPFALLLTQQGS